MAIVTVTAHLQLQPGPGRGLGVEVCLAGVVGLVEAEDGGGGGGQRGELLTRPRPAPDHRHKLCYMSRVTSPLLYVILVKFSAGKCPKFRWRQLVYA